MSTDIFVVLDNGQKASIVTPTKIINVVSRARKPEDAVTKLLDLVPPNAVKCAFVNASTGFLVRKKSIRAFQKAGYNKVKVIEIFSYGLSAAIYNQPLDCAIGEPVIIIVGLEQFLPVTECVAVVLEKCEKGWQIAHKGLLAINAILEYPSVRHVIAYKGTPDYAKSDVMKLLPECTVHIVDRLPPNWKYTYFSNKAIKGNLNGYEVAAFCPDDLIIQYGETCELVKLSEMVPPFTITKTIDIGSVYTVNIRDTSKDQRIITKIDTFKHNARRTVTIIITVDMALVPQVQLKTLKMRFEIIPHTKVNTKFTVKAKRKLTSPPTTILTFTSDNRILIESDETYTGNAEVPAYVRLLPGKAPQTLKQAYNYLPKAPKSSVCYDIPRLLARDFNPDQPDPSWAFKTSRDTDGKVIVHAGFNLTALPIVLFGLLVQSTFQYIQKQQTSPIAVLGIKLPADTVVSVAEMRDIAQRIGVNLVLLDD
uniref:AMP-binding domain-containing protein n=1 Tax=Panagrellus redivivus TaxID=6233 RepID=A0A7E4V6K1_PANRE